MPLKSLPASMTATVTPLRKPEPAAQREEGTVTAMRDARAPQSNQHKNGTTPAPRPAPAAPRRVLLLRCEDVPGIVAAVSSFLAEQGLFIVESAQFGGKNENMFFMRVVFCAADPASGAGDLKKVREAFAPVAEKYGMESVIADLEEKRNCLLLVSHESHCMHDILYRAESGILPVKVAAVASNHRKLEHIAERYGVPFRYLPVTKETRQEQEAQIAALIEEYDVSLTVLAKYMQILTPSLVKKLAGRAINIHHSFLPSFKGGKPYHQAYERGVKIIGATAHYVSDDLDEGPIIEQEVTRADRPSSPADLAAAGRDVEAAVLSRAVKYHLEYRVLMNGNKTVVFN